jgi:hypothetical protein
MPGAALLQHHVLPCLARQCVHSVAVQSCVPVHYKRADADMNVQHGILTLRACSAMTPVCLCCHSANAASPEPLHAADRQRVCPVPLPCH